MPRYDYKCKKCNKNIEVSHGIDEMLETCESCGGELRRVFHPVGIVFKGSGFYATDSKKPDNKASKPPEKEEKPAEKVSSGDNGGKKEAEKKTTESAKSSK